jgi:hypothetical protein
VYAHKKTKKKQKKQKKMLWIFMAGCTMSAVSTPACHSPHHRKIPILSSPEATRNMTFLFLKFRQVGGTSVARLLTATNPKVNTRKVADHFIDLSTFRETYINEASSSVFAAKLTHADAPGDLPCNCFAMTILRDPLENDFSHFWKFQFPFAGEMHYKPNPQLDQWLGSGESRAEHGGWANVELVMSAFRRYMELNAEYLETGEGDDSIGHAAFSQYSLLLNTPEIAERFLSQFALVGVTEAFDAFVAKLCILTEHIQWSSEESGLCTDIAQAEHANRVDLKGPPTLTRVEFADLPVAFVSEMRRMIPANVTAIYNIAKKLAHFQA